MKKLFLLVLTVGLSLNLFANERSVEDAAALAAQFTNQLPAVQSARRMPASASSMRLAHTRTKVATQTPAFYVFNADNGGFVIVSADDNTVDVLGYSDKGSFDEQHINPNFQYWLGRLQRQISRADAAHAVSRAQAPASVTAIAPLLVNSEGEEITWYQEAPYNNLCPKDNSNQRSLTGCVATAAAMIMYKWQYPTKGIGSHSYDWCLSYNNNDECTSSRTLSVTFSNTTYEWANMLPAYENVSSTSAQKTAVATLMYHCGVAAEMEYSSEGSGAYTDYMARGLVENFGYEMTKYVNTMTQDNYEYGGEYPAAVSNVEYEVTISELTDYFNADLEAGYPILMGGTYYDTEHDGEYGGGHEFVCDGRDSQGYFHINWGWEGEGNGYFSLSALEAYGQDTSDPEYYVNFSDAIDAVIGLHPGSTSGGESGGESGEETPIEGEVGQFVLATANSQLAVGQQILIVNEDASVALSTNQKTNNRGQADVTISNHTITLDDSSDAQVLTLTEGASSGTYAFYTGTGYLYAASKSKNHLKTQTSVDGNASWAIDIASSGVASIIAQGDNTRNELRYNNDSNNGQLFSCYGSGNTQQDVYIYIQVEESDPTALPTTEQGAIKPIKQVRNGQLLIYIGEHVYNAQGQRLY